MTDAEYVSEWYATQVIDPNNPNFMICPYCNEKVFRTRFTGHIFNYHNRNFEELVEECCLFKPLPLCKLPGCNNPVSLHNPTKLGAGISEYCCKNHGSSDRMRSMRADPTLRALHAEAASKRFRENNPTWREENRRKASDRMSARWETDEHREKVSTAARDNINRLLEDASFREKKASAASKRMTGLNKDRGYRENLEAKYDEYRENNPNFTYKLAMHISASKLPPDKIFIYLLEYDKYVKIGVTSDVDKRLSHLYGYTEKNVWGPLSRDVAISIEYFIKCKYDQYSASSIIVSEKTEVFHLNDLDNIKGEIEELISSEYIDDDLNQE